MTVINAFHKDFVKTYMPEINAHLKKENKYEMASQMMATYVDNKRKTDPAHGTIHSLLKPMHVVRAPEDLKRKKPTTKERVDLAPKEFKIFSRAGTANVKPKGKKK